MFINILTVVLSISMFLGLSAGNAEATIKSQKVVYMVGAKEFTGYLAYDDSISGKRPGVIVVHEWWGHDAYARKRADMLAAQGYTALALDMYGTGILAEHPKDAGTFATEASKNPDVKKARFLAALDELKKHATVDATKMAAIGYCFGGSVVLDMARAGVELDGVVSYHSSLNLSIKPKSGGVKAKVRVFHGGDDKFVKKKTLDNFLTEMNATGADFKFVGYPGVVHSFTSPEATARGEKFGLPLAYNAEADADSWSQTMDFFKAIF
jgi:dienelactone hydrolase